MKNKYVWLLLIAFIAKACEQAEQNITMDPPETADPWAKNSNIYEVNVRQYTPEGTFNAFMPYLDTLEDLGADILWFMPVHPIGDKERKGKMGSYYAVRDYKAINPNFGTEEDFRTLVDSAHAKGFKVILDWVANHTAWDHAWVDEHPEYYTQDTAGNRPVVPEGTDWTDVADLNYDNVDLQEEMIKAMKFWVEKYDVDGYRCDVAGMVPMDFWIRVVDTLNNVKPVFMLAEWDEPRMHRAFHMTYAWDFHHQLKRIAERGDPQQIIKDYMAEEHRKYPDSAYRMVFTTNHDENTWNKTVFERYGDNVAPLTVLTFTLFGMPLVYSGQEAGLNESLRFFDKDTIHWGKSPWRPFYKKLLELNETKEALWNGEYGAPAEWIESPDGTLAYSRRKDGNAVIVYLNFTTEPINIVLKDAGQTIFMKDEQTVVQETGLTLSGHGYYIGETEKN